MDVEPKYNRVLPTTIKKFTYPPTKKQAVAVKNIVDFYDFDLQSICNRYNKKGRKVLIITDDFITYRIKGESDLDRNCIFSGEEGGVVQNILAYCMGQVKNPETIKEVAIVNWAFGDLKREKDAKGKSAKDVANQGIANAVFYKRLISLIEDYEPDTVVLAGLDMFDYVVSHLKNDFKTNHRIYTNRLISAKINDFKFQLMGCIDLKRPCSWEGVTVKDFPMLIGFLCHGLIQALQGRNSYTLRIPQDVRFINVNTIEKFDRMMRQMWKERIVSIDTETDSLARVQNILYTIQFCWNGKDGYVLPVDHPDTPFTLKERKYIKKALQKYFEFGKSLYHIYQNGKFDIAVLYATLNVRYYNHRVYDIQAGEWNFDENRKLLSEKTLKYNKPSEGKPFKPYALDFIAEGYGCKVYRNIEFSKGNRGAISVEGLTKRFIEYAAYDVIIPFHLQELQIQRAKANGNKKFLKFVCEQLGDTIIACSGMEHVGAYVSKEKLFNLKDKNGPLKVYANERIKEFENSKAAIKVNEYLKKKQGVPEGQGVFRKGIWLFNIRDQKHQQLLFFNALKLEGLGQKKNSSDFQVNAKFKKTYADVPDVQRFNEIGKASTVSNTFVTPTYEKLREDIDCRVDSRIRSSFDYLYVGTGRLSSVKPNLTNIPNRGDLSKFIKDIYEAKFGCLLVENDFSAHEVREWANEAEDEKLCSAFYTGLKYRQQLRILMYKYRENLIAWDAYKKEVDWYKEVDKKPFHTFEDKSAFIQKLNDPITQEIGFAELELEAKGDLHKYNASLFFSLKSALEVTKTQRDEIKAVVFGVIYGKVAYSLAKPVAEGGLGKDEEYCQGLIDTLFTTFPQGYQYLLQQHKFGRENLFVENKLGMQRHLWPYLHNKDGFLNATDRRGPNTIFQGTASQIGVKSMRLMQKLLWNLFIKHDVKLDWRTMTNFVHDSVKSEVPYHFIPVYVYLMEHASTTLIHKNFSEVYGYELSVGLELEFGIGASLATSKTWNFSSIDLYAKCEKSMEAQIGLGHKVDIKKEMKTIKHNWNIIENIRLKELEKSVKSKLPNKAMFMNENNARELGLILH